MKWLRIYLRVLGRLDSEKPLARRLVAANVLLAVAAFAEPLLFGRIIDALTRAGRAPSRHVFELLAAWAFFGLFSIGAGVFVALHADRLSHRRRLAVTADYFEHVLKLPIAFHAGTHSGRVLKTMLDGASAMWTVWLALFREHCASFVGLFVLLPLTLCLNVWLGSFLVLLVALFGALTAYVFRRTDTLQSAVEQYQSAMAERAADAIGNLAVVQSFTQIEREARAFRLTAARVLDAQLPVLSWWAVVTVATRASSTLTVLAIFTVGVALYASGQTSVGEIVMFANFATLLIARLEHVVQFVNFVFAQAPKLRNFFEVLDTVPGVSDRPGARELAAVSGAVRFAGVSFSYDGARNAVEQLEFSVEPGQTIALVGTTGSGKSTTLALLHRSFDPQQGAIYVDGVDIRDVTAHSLRKQIGVVFQEPMLFARSIRENLLIGKPDASDAEIWQALARAQASDVVENQPEGLDTLIGERARRLSGGERQRLAIARALLKNPPILILDEATSALDASTEAKLKRALQAVTASRTTFVIAHRLSTIQHADRVLVFERGRVIEAGRFDELVARNGRLAELARSQFMAAAELSAQQRS